MARYETRAARYSEQLYDDAADDRTIVIDESGPIPTGVYDKYGREYVRMPERIGFHTRRAHTGDG